MNKLNKEDDIKFEITQEQLEEMVNFAHDHPTTQFYTEIMNDGELFLSCTFFDKNDDNASGFWELSIVSGGEDEK